jgi:pyrimidine and pyridine-specific 5'-nucleotidase
MTLKTGASSNASGSTTIRNAPASRSANATPVPPVTRMSTSIPGSVSSRRISVRGSSLSVAGSTRLSFKTAQTVEPLENETPPRTRVASLTPSKKTPQSLPRSPSLKSPSISLTTPSPQSKTKLNSSSSITPPSKFSFNNTENSSTTTPSRPKLSLYSSPTHIKHPNTPGSKSGSPAAKNSLGRKSGSAAALLLDHSSLVLSRQPKTTTTALTSSNGTGTVVATDDGWLSGIGDSGDAFWEAEDDMSLEMLTDVNDGNVDEELSFSFFFYLPLFKPSQTNPPIS